MEQHPIPQNVTTFQFRLIGDMTIKQFGYLVGGAICGYISYKLPLPFFITWPLACLFGLGGFGFAFVPIEERPMDIWVLSFFKNIYSPTQFVWQKTRPIPEASARLIPTTAQATPVQPTAPVTPIQALPTPSPVTIKAQAPPSSPFPTTIPTPHAPKPETGAAPAPRPQAKPAPHHDSLLTTLERVFHTPHTKTGVSHPPEVSHPTEMLPSYRPAPHTTKKSTSDPFAWFKDLFSSPPKPVYTTQQSFTPIIQGAKPLGSITGTRIDIAPTTPPAVSAAQKQSPQSPSVNTTMVKEAQEKAAQLEHSVETLEEELKTKGASEDRVRELQQQMMDIVAQKSTMEQELIDLRRKLEVKTQAQPVVTPTMPTPGAAPAAPTVRVVTADMATKAGLPRLTTFANVVTGIVKDNEGNLLPGVLITVRDKEDIPLRALKTNKLGQFAASTPLSSGTYIIEVEDPRSRFIFDRVQVGLSGTVLPALEIIAKSQKQISRAKLEKEIFGNTQI